MQNTRATYEGVLKLAPDRAPVRDDPRLLCRRPALCGDLDRRQYVELGASAAVDPAADQPRPVGLRLCRRRYRRLRGRRRRPNCSPAGSRSARSTRSSATIPEGQAASRKSWVDGPEQVAIRRRYIEERYRLMPYLYALADENSRTGLPLMRPVFLEYPAVVQGRSRRRDRGPVHARPRPADRAAADLGIARALRHLPARRRLVRLLDRRADRRGETRQRRPQLDRLPVFVRPGAILPRQPLVQSTGETPKGALELDVYPRRRLPRRRSISMTATSFALSARATSCARRSRCDCGPR